MRSRYFSMVLVFVVGVVAGAGTLVWAQSERASALPADVQPFGTTTDTAGKVVTPTQSRPVLLSGDALALRVAGTRHGRVVGTLLANVDGRWVEVQFATKDVLAGR